ncbi:MAG: DUF1559 domain-containing protein [Paludisphaera borealis]|uniref:DUF1559 family PulG-like putative transporter n=1 Tax=Paludisphaera borealis TaxID=1387353 RepID=UPI0028463887|nr:DUF1559 domain-containing protein [Paludisphaera borealis]MDR3621243.1 DUF1559 domain-containing protein [Paludisphaera borealis]
MAAPEPELATSPEVLFIGDEPEPTATSVKAVVSLVVGSLFFFACLSGLPAIFLGSYALHDIHHSKRRLRGRGMAIAGIVLGASGCLFTLILFLISMHSPKESALRYQCVNNLKHIALAMYNYHGDNGSLPTSAITDKDGRPLLSWRVAVLPYLADSELHSLYARFHLDEPWNSPHNFALLDLMPRFYACPSDQSRKSGMTNYQAVVGPGAAFTPDFKPLRLEDFTDGPDKTIVVAETTRAVPWTKPEDLPFDGVLPLAVLGSRHGSQNNGFNVSFADGSVRFLKCAIRPSVLHALLTRNGGETLSTDSY